MYGSHFIISVHRTYLSEGLIITSSEDIAHNSTKDNTVLTFRSSLRPEVQQCTYTFLQRHTSLPSSTTNAFMPARCTKVLVSCRGSAFRNSPAAQIINDELESSHSNPSYTTCRSHPTKHTILLKSLQIPQMHFGFVNVISLYGNYLHVSATHVAIFRVESARIQNIFIVRRYHTIVKIIQFWLQ
jgi:hypothetical protein